MWSNQRIRELTRKVPPVNLRLWTIEMEVSNRFPALEFLVQLWNAEVVIEITHLLLKYMLYHDFCVKFDLGPKVCEKASN